MNKKCLAAVIALSILSLTAVALWLHSKAEKDDLAKAVMNYDREIEQVERSIIQSTPVYRDYVKPAIERELMKYNLIAHGRAVVKHCPKPMTNVEDIKKNTSSGRLISLDSVKKRNYYFHNVRKEYRFLTPRAAQGLVLVANTFQKKLQEYNPKTPTVKLAVSSVIRTVNYQEKIFGRKFVSSHSFGGCFDIFFEDFFVVLPQRDFPGMEGKMFRHLRRHVGFLLGDALRRQFRTVLSQTLIELQRRGEIYVFLENDRRCYHITVLKKSR